MSKADFYCSLPPFASRDSCRMKSSSASQKSRRDLQGKESVTATANRRGDTDQETETHSCWTQISSSAGEAEN